MALSPAGAAIETGSSAVATRSSRRRTLASGSPAAGSAVAGGAAVVAGAAVAALVAAAWDDGFGLPEQAVSSSTATTATARRQAIRGLIASILAAAEDLRATGPIGTSALRRAGRLGWGRRLRRGGRLEHAAGDLGEGELAVHGRPAHAHEGLLLGEAELLHQLALGALDHLARGQLGLQVLDRLLEVAVLGREQLRRLERLDQVPDRAGLRRALDQILVREGGQHQHRAGALLDDPGGRLDPVQLGHLHVHDHELRGQLAGELERLLAVARLAHDGVAALLQGLDDVHPDQDLVLRHEHPCHLVSLSRSPVRFARPHPTAGTRHLPEVTCFGAATRSQDRRLTARVSTRIRQANLPEAQQDPAKATRGPNRDPGAVPDGGSGGSCLGLPPDGSPSRAPPRIYQAPVPSWARSMTATSARGATRQKATAACSQSSSKAAATAEPVSSACAETSSRRKTSSISSGWAAITSSWLTRPRASPAGSSRNSSPPVMPAPMLRPTGPSTITVPPVMYSAQWSPAPSTTAVAPELRTAKRSPARPAQNSSPLVAPYRTVLPTSTGEPASSAGGRITMRPPPMPLPT